MPLAKPVWKVPMCNRQCEPLLKCPPGSHVSKSHRSCVWHGRDNSASKPGILSSIVNSLTPTPRPQIFEREPATADSSFNDYLRNRAANTEPEFGGGGRRKRSSRRRSRKSRKRSSKRKTRSRRKSKHSGGKRKSRHSGGKRKSKHGGKRRSRRSRHF